MKRENKLSVRIGSTVFSIEESAYRALEVYLDDIAARLEGNAKEEVLGDVEMRIADLLSGWLGAPEGVVDIYLVRKVQEQIGRPEEFGELQEPSKKGDEEPTKRLLRTSADKVIGGVCGGVAKFTRIDPTLLRIITLLLIFFGGLSLWIYIVLWIIIPLDTKVLDK